MDYETVTPAAFGASLTGIGVNLVVRDVARAAAFLEHVMGLTLWRRSADFAIAAHGGQVLQLHSDATFARHPLSGLLPETPPRGAGVELRLFGVDPDAAAARAEAAGHLVLQPPADKPHGLREACILDPDGYLWVPSLPLGPDGPG